MMRKSTQFRKSIGFLLSTALLVAASLIPARAQTVLINPAGDGGFESGTTFAANGWTVVNNTSATANNWALSTGAPSGFTGTNAAYITNNLAGTPPPSAYDNTTSSTVHFYRDVIFPAGQTNISFSFSEIQAGEVNYDRILVYISNAAPSGTPVVSVPLSSGTTLSGYTLIQTTAVYSSWTTVNVPITAAQAGNATATATRRILFVWQNDGSGGAAPAAVDNISLTASCGSPVTGLTVSGVTTTAGNLSWAAVTGATSYNVRYKKVTDPVTTATWATPTNTTTTTLPLTGLSANTAYEYQVAAIGSSCAVYTSSFTFNTLCGLVTTFPYLESFASAIPTCWSATEGATGATYHWVPTSSDAAHGAAGPKAGSNFMYLYTYLASTSYNTYNLTTTAFALPAGTPKDLTYYYYLGNDGYKGTTGATGSDPYPLTVQISTNGGATFTDVFTHSTANSTFATSSAVSFWTKNTIRLSTYAGQTVLFRFRSNSNYGSSFCDQGIDEFKIDDPCTAPAITATAPGTRCGIGTVSLGITTTPGAVVKWYAAATGGTALFTGNPFVTPVIGGTTTYYVTTTDTAAACEMTVRTAVTATVTPAPVITASATPATICSGSSAAVAVATGNPAYTFSWSSGQTTNGFSATPTTTTKYVVTATDSVSRCVAKDSVTVTVLTQAAAITAPASTNICIGASVLLTATSGTGLTYQWYNGTTAISGATAATYSATTTGVYSVRVTNTATTCSALSSTVAVNVFPPPVATITPAGAINLCNGSTVVLTAPAGTSYTYQWKNGTANAAGTSTAATYSATVGGVYTVVISANGCSTTSAATTITILPLPTAAISPATATAGCDTVRLQSRDTGVLYQWNYNGAPIIGARSNFYTAAASGNYSLTNISIANGCVLTSPSVAITVNPSPLGIISSAAVTFCDGGAVVLNTYAGINQSYQWSVNGIIIPGATTADYIVSKEGSYSVKVVNTVTGCSRVSPGVAIAVNPKPVPVIVYQAATNTLTTTQAFSTYQWFVNTVAVAGAVNRNFTPAANGAYAVSVTDSNGCSNTSPIQFLNSVGIRNTAAGAAIRIYPNPAKDVLHVTSPVKVNLVLRDITGKIVLTGEDKTDLNLEPLADGMYLLYITDHSGQLIRAEKITKSVN